MYNCQNCQNALSKYGQADIHIIKQPCNLFCQYPIENFLILRECTLYNEILVISNLNIILRVLSKKSLFGNINKKPEGHVSHVS